MIKAMRGCAKSVVVEDGVLEYRMRCSFRPAYTEAPIRREARKSSSD